MGRIKDLLSGLRNKKTRKTKRPDPGHHLVMMKCPLDAKLLLIKEWLTLYR
jgi:hypothetical protein